MNMRQLLAMAAFVLLVALTPVVAQHGGGHVSAGGHVSSGGHGGFAGHSGFSGNSGGHNFGSMRSGSGFAGQSAPRTFPHAPLSSSSRNFNHFRGPRERRRGFRNNCYGCGWGYGYPYAYPYAGGGIDPYWWWDSGSPNDNYQEQQGQTESADNMSAGNYEAQPGDQDAYARPPSPSAPQQDERTEAPPPTVLVFRDQHRQEVQNYAIVGQTLWSFAPQHTQKILLADLDLPATTKVNDERGVDFRVPSTGQGQ
jgi:hypothetical protein